MSNIQASGAIAAMTSVALSDVLCDLPQGISMCPKWVTRRSVNSHARDALVAATALRTGHHSPSGVEATVPPTCVVPLGDSRTQLRLPEPWSVMTTQVRDVHQPLERVLSTSPLQAVARFSLRGWDAETWGLDAEAVSRSTKNITKELDLMPDDSRSASTEEGDEKSSQSAGSDEPPPVAAVQPSGSRGRNQSHRINLSTVVSHDEAFDEKQHGRHVLANDCLPSIGSLGHPHCCSSPCPFRKRKGGCREGAECTRCHLCDWSRQHISMRAPEALVTMRCFPCNEEEAPEPPEPQKEKLSISIGTMGHPVSCTGPCKYVWRKGGCKDAAACRKCHRCVWQRAGVKEPSVFEHTPNRVISEPTATLQDLIKLALCAEAIEAPQGKVARAVGEDSQTEVIEFQCTASIGSRGHPHSCAAPCKFALKSKGCKDGEHCAHCHLCRWKPKMATKQWAQPLPMVARA